MEAKQLNLNLGCGTDIIDNWINIDINPQDKRVNKYDISRIGDHFKADSVDNIKLAHVLEHFTYEEGATLIRQCHTILKSGGNIYIEMPNLRKICAYIIDSGIGNREFYLKQLFGNQSTVWEYHKSGYDYEMLAHLVTSIGFKQIENVKMIQGREHCTGIQCIK